MRRLALSLLFALGAASSAYGQAAVQQSGPVVPYHPPVWTQNGVVSDGGTTSTPAISAVGTFNGSECPLGVSSQTAPGASSAAHSQFTFCQSDTRATFKFYGINGQPTPQVYFDLGGVLYPFPVVGGTSVFVVPSVAVLTASHGLSQYVLLYLSAYGSGSIAVGDGGEGTFRQVLACTDDGAITCTHDADGTAFSRTNPNGTIAQAGLTKGSPYDGLTCQADRSLCQDSGTRLTAVFAASKIYGDGTVRTGGIPLVFNTTPPTVPAGQTLDCGLPLRGQQIQAGTSPIPYYTLPGFLVVKNTIGPVINSGKLQNCGFVSDLINSTVWNQIVSDGTTRSLVDNYTNKVTGTALSVTGESATAQNIFIAGFDTCIDVSNSARGGVQNAQLDCPLNLYDHDQGGGIRIADLNIENYVENGFTVGATKLKQVTYPLTPTISDDGAGRVKLTYTAAADQLAAGDPVLVAGMGNTSAIALTGDLSSTVMKVSNLPNDAQASNSVEGVLIGALASDTGGCIPGNTIVTSVDYGDEGKNNGSVTLNKQPTCDVSQVALTFRNNNAGVPNFNGLWHIAVHHVNGDGTSYVVLTGSSFAGPTDPAASWVAGANAAKVLNTVNIAPGQYLCASGTAPYCTEPTGFVVPTATLSDNVGTGNNNNVHVSGVTNWPSPGMLKIGTESISYTVNVSSGTVNFTGRGQDGTTPASHSSGDTITIAAPQVQAVAYGAYAVVLNAVAQSSQTGQTVQFANDPTIYCTTCGQITLSAVYHSWSKNSVADAAPIDRMRGLGSAGNTSTTLTLASSAVAARVFPGQGVVDLTNSGYLQSGTTVSSISGTAVTLSVPTAHAIASDQISFTGCGYPTGQPWQGNCTATGVLLADAGTDFSSLHSHGWRVYVHLNNGRQTFGLNPVFDSGTQTSALADPGSVGILAEGNTDKISIGGGKAAASTDVAVLSSQTGSGVVLTGGINLRGDVTAVNTGRLMLSGVHGSSPGYAYVDSSQAAFSAGSTSLPNVSFAYDDPANKATTFCADGSNSFADSFCSGTYQGVTATGASSPQSLADIAAAVQSVVQYGAVCNLQYSTTTPGAFKWAILTSGSKNVTWPFAMPASAVGQRVSFVGPGATFNTTIATADGTTSGTLADNATFSTGSAGTWYVTNVASIVTPLSGGTEGDLLTLSDGTTARVVTNSGAVTVPNNVQVVTQHADTTSPIGPTLTATGGTGNGLTVRVNATPLGQFIWGSDAGVAINAAIQTIAAAHANATVRIPGCLTTVPIVVPPGIALIGTGSGKTKSPGLALAAPGAAVLDWQTGSTGKIFGGGAQDLAVDGFYNAQDTILVEAGERMNFRGVIAYNGIRSYWRQTNGGQFYNGNSGQVDVTWFPLPSQAPTYGWFEDTGAADDKIDGLTISGAKTAGVFINNNADNYMNVHVFGFPTYNTPDDCFRIGYKVKMVNLTCDGANVAEYHLTNTLDLDNPPVISNFYGHWGARIAAGVDFVLIDNGVTNCSLEGGMYNDTEANGVVAAGTDHCYVSWIDPSGSFNQRSGSSATTQFFNNVIVSNNAQGPQTNLGAATTGVPVFVPNHASSTTGFGSSAIGNATIVAGGTDRVTVTTGVQVGAPTGGDEGAGTINATAFLENGARLPRNGVSLAGYSTLALNGTTDDSAALNTILLASSSANTCFVLPSGKTLAISAAAIRFRQAGECFIFNNGAKVKVLNGAAAIGKMFSIEANNVAILAPEGWYGEVDGNSANNTNVIIGVRTTGDVTGAFVRNIWVHNTTGKAFYWQDEPDVTLRHLKMDHCSDLSGSSGYGTCMLATNIADTGNARIDAQDLLVDRTANDPTSVNLAAAINIVGTATHPTYGHFCHVTDKEPINPVAVYGAIGVRNAPLEYCDIEGFDGSLGLSLSAPNSWPVLVNGFRWTGGNQWSIEEPGGFDPPVHNVAVVNFALDGKGTDGVIRNPLPISIGEDSTGAVPCLGSLVLTNGVIKNFTDEGIKVEGCRKDVDITDVDIDASSVTGAYFGDMAGIVMRNPTAGQQGPQRVNIRAKVHGGGVATRALLMQNVTGVYGSLDADGVNGPTIEVRSYGTFTTDHINLTVNSGPNNASSNQLTMTTGGGGSPAFGADINIGGPNFIPEAAGWTGWFTKAASSLIEVYGSASPEGVEDGAIGSIAHDTTNHIDYRKSTAPATLTGWQITRDAAGHAFSTGTQVAAIATSGSANDLTTPRRTVSSGATDTAAITDFIVLWNSSNNSTHTQNIYACTGALASYHPLIISDAKGNGATSTIDIVPASGTVMGATDLLLNANYESATLQCDGSSNWVLQ